VDAPAIHFDPIAAFLHLHAKRGDHFPVHRDVARGNQLLGAATGRHPGGSQKFL
jgi:hypothetical protein